MPNVSRGVEACDEGLQEVFVYLPDEVARFLAENGENLADLLRREGLAVNARLEVDPAEPSGSRDLTLVLLATAAVITALTPTLTRIISAISNRPVLAKELRLRPVEDIKGRVLRDANGNPILHWID